MPTSTETSRAHTVLEHTKSSVATFFDVFDAIMLGKGGGGPKDGEQDLLRAALVFAAAGLDSCIKELIRDSLKSLSKIDDGVQQEFEIFVQRQLRGELEDTDGIYGYKFLASVLASSHPQSKLLNEYVYYLIGTSLQSVEQLFKAYKALGIETKFIVDNKAKLVTIFDVRNKIIHELDINLAGQRGHRARNSRRRPDLEGYTNLLIEVANKAIDLVETKLQLVVN